MFPMLRHKGVYLLAPLAMVLTSCAIVTINVNFPAREVRKAYDSLEEEFLTQPPQGEKAAPPAGGTGSSSGVPSGRLEPRGGGGGGEVLSLRKFSALLSFLDLDLTPPPAWAQEELAARITAEMRSMPEVVRAYERRRARLGAVRSLLEAGKVGEANDGMLAPRAALSAHERAVVKVENADRRVIIRGMAKAIVKLNRMPLSERNIKEVYPKAARQFAETRREKAAPGWWIQLPGGKWVRK